MRNTLYGLLRRIVVVVEYSDLDCDFFCLQVGVCSYTISNENRERGVVSIIAGQELCFCLENDSRYLSGERESHFPHKGKTGK